MRIGRPQLPPRPPLAPSSSAALRVVSYSQGRSDLGWILWLQCMPPLLQWGSVGCQFHHEYIHPFAKLIAFRFLYIDVCRCICTIDIVWVLSTVTSPHCVQVLIAACVPNAGNSSSWQKNPAKQRDDTAHRGSLDNCAVVSQCSLSLSRHTSVIGSLIVLESELLVAWTHWMPAWWP